MMDAIINNKKEISENDIKILVDMDNDNFGKMMILLGL